MLLMSCILIYEGYIETNYYLKKKHLSSANRKGAYEFCDIEF